MRIHYAIVQMCVLLVSVFNRAIANTTSFEISLGQLPADVHISKHHHGQRFWLFGGCFRTTFFETFEQDAFYHYSNNFKKHVNPANLNPYQ